MTTQAAREVASPLDERAIAEHLLEHSDFLERHPEVLEHLRLRHEAGRAVSLIERQVDILRTRNQQIQGRLNQMLELARENEARVWHLNTLARTLITAETPADVLSGITDCLKRDFQVDAVFLGLKGECGAQGPEWLAAGDIRRQTYDNFFRLGRIACGGLNADDALLLYPQWPASAAPLTSAAWIPLGRPTASGMLVLASDEATRFEPDMGTLFLELLGDLVAAALRNHLG